MYGPRNFKRIPTVLLFLFFALNPLCESKAQNQITITDLGTLGGFYSAAADINDRGQVAGFSQTRSGDMHAFLWSDGQMIDLGTLGGHYSFAYGLNNLGQVVGNSRTASGEEHAFLWQDGVMIDLGTLGGANSYAFDINDAGQIVGTAWNGFGFHHHAFLYSNGLMNDLNIFNYSSGNYATGINASGQIVGSGHTDGSYHGFLHKDGVTIDIGALGCCFTEAYDINDVGQVVGSSGIGNGQSRAFLYSNGQMVNLGTIGQGSSVASGINNYGQIVGSFSTAQRSHMFLYDPINGMRDLNDLLPPSSGWELTGDSSGRRPRGINNVGHVAGTGLHRIIRPGYDNIEVRAFLMSVGLPDSVAPTSMRSISPMPNNFGWSNTDVLIAIQSADDEGGAGVKEVSYSAVGTQNIPVTTVNGSVASLSITAEGITTVTYFAVDSAGNAETPQAISIKIDKSLPSLTATATVGGFAYTSGMWTNQDVLINFSCADVGPSGVGSVSGPITVDMEGAGQSAMGVCTDNANNTSFATFSGINVDKTAPVLSVPPGILVDATSPSGTFVAYAASATDNLDTSPYVNCSPPSGRIFTVGDTIVQCSALDDAGNSATRSFNVHVKDASEQISDLGSIIDSFNIHRGTANSLKAKLREAQQALAASDMVGACVSMDNFMDQARAQSGKKLTASQAAELISEAIQIKLALGCS